MYMEERKNQHIILNTEAYLYSPYEATISSEQGI